MKQESRRQILSKLGLGAAALAVSSVAGVSQASAAGWQPTDEYDFAQAFTNNISFSISPAPKNGNKMLVVIAGDGNGLKVAKVAYTSAYDSRNTGLAADGMSLTLGVTVNMASTKGGVSIMGLDTLLNRQGTANGRCTVTTGDISLPIPL